MPVHCLEKAMRLQESAGTDGPENEAQGPACNPEKDDEDVQSSLQLHPAVDQQGSTKCAQMK